MRNAKLNELQAGIKIDGKNTNNLRYADDFTLMAESREELKSLLLRLKESERASLKLRSWHLVPFSSVAQSCPTLCNPMNCSMPGLPVHHHFPEFTQTHIHQVDDAIQPSHSLSSPSPPAFNLSQYQGLFQ